MSRSENENNDKLNCLAVDKYFIPKFSYTERFHSKLFKVYFDLPWEVSHIFRTSVISEALYQVDLSRKFVDFYVKRLGLLLGWVRLTASSYMHLCLKQVEAYLAYAFGDKNRLPIFLNFNLRSVRYILYPRLFLLYYL